jgi:hypothetical protein
MTRQFFFETAQHGYTYFRQQTMTTSMASSAAGDGCSAIAGILSHQQPIERFQLSRCILCKRKMQGRRRPAHCRNRRCPAWRCRYDDQCEHAHEACPLCGKFKPEEFSSGEARQTCLHRPEGIPEHATATICNDGKIEYRWLTEV